jgi:glycosyltransferase involved in cell wall biosynthesis
VQASSNLGYLADWARKKPARRLEVLQNWLAPARLAGTSIEIEKTPFAGRKIFVYIGNMGVAQSMDIIIDLAESLQQRKDIGFLFVGRGSEVARLKQNVKQRALDNVLFFNEVESKEMPSLLSACNVGLIALDPRHKSHNIPGKFLTYMQAGLPVLARVNAGTDLIDIIERHGVGCVYVGDDISELKALAEGLIDDKSELLYMSQRGQELSCDMFSSVVAASQIVAALRGEGQVET